MLQKLQPGKTALLQSTHVLPLFLPICLCCMRCRQALKSIHNLKRKYILHFANQGLSLPLLGLLLASRNFNGALNHPAQFDMPLTSQQYATWLYDHG